MTFFAELNLGSSVVTYELFIKVLTTLIFDSTALHAVVGGISYITRDARICGGRFRPRQTINDVQNCVQVYVGAIVVNWKQVELMNDWTYLLLEDDKFHETKAVLDEFQEDLQDICERVDRLNHFSRPVPANGFNPKFFHSALNV